VNAEQGISFVVKQLFFIFKKSPLLLRDKNLRDKEEK